MAELETERITFALQEQKASKLAREDRPSDLGSTPPSVTDDDGRSNISALSESGVHASQASLPLTTSDENAPQDAAQPAPTAQKSRKSKLQLWNDLKISGKNCREFDDLPLADYFLKQLLELSLLYTHWHYLHSLLASNLTCLAVAVISPVSSH